MGRTWTSHIPVIIHITENIKCAAKPKPRTAIVAHRAKGGEIATCSINTVPTWTHQQQKGQVGAHPESVLKQAGRIQSLRPDLRECKSMTKKEWVGQLCKGIKTKCEINVLLKTQ